MKNQTDSKANENTLEEIKNLSYKNIFDSYESLDALCESLDSCFDLYDVGYCDEITQKRYEMLARLSALNLWGLWRYFRGSKVDEINFACVYRSLPYKEGEMENRRTVFIGYDIPKALEMKYEVVMPMLDKLLKPIDLDGDQCHVIEKEEQRIFVESLLINLNDFHDINLTADIEILR